MKTYLGNNRWVSSIFSKNNPSEILYQNSLYCVWEGPSGLGTFNHEMGNQGIIGGRIQVRLGGEVGVKKVKEFYDPRMNAGEVKNERGEIIGVYFCVDVRAKEGIVVPIHLFQEDRYPNLGEFFPFYQLIDTGQNRYIQYSEDKKSIFCLETRKFLPISGQFLVEQLERRGWLEIELGGVPLRIEGELTEPLYEDDEFLGGFSRQIFVKTAETRNPNPPKVESRDQEELKHPVENFYGGRKINLFLWGILRGNSEGEVKGFHKF